MSIPFFVGLDKYNLSWPEDYDELAVELAMIRLGGKCTVQGKECGLGLFDHLMEARRLVWPHRYRHRWTELMYHNFIENDLTVLMGCASSQKTSHAVEYSLLNYWARPDNTLVVLSTVNMDKLDIGVWAELKMLWTDGRERYPWLAGNIIEHKRALTTGSLEEDGVRDFRCGVIGRPCYTGGKWVGLGILAGLKQDYIFYVADECFPAGTMVDTPSGPTPIERIIPGDYVISAIGPNRVFAIRESFTENLVRVHLKNGTSITCTPNHPFFTQDGWIYACNLSEKHYILSPYETMRLVQEGIPPNVGSSISLRELQEHSKDLRAVREGIYTEKTEKRSEVLRSILLRYLDNNAARSKEKTLRNSRGEKEEVRVQDGMVEKSGRLEEKPRSHNENKEPDAQSRVLCESGSGDTCIGSVSESSRREWNRPIESGVAAYANVSRGDLELSSKDRDETRQRLPSMLQSRFGISEHKTVHRSGRELPQQSNPQSKGPEETEIPRGAWVDRVEVLKQDDPEFHKSSSNPGRCRIYNLQVEVHHSYSVNGLVVKNCQFMEESFSLSWPHLFSNGCVKIIASGNPKHDPDDELGRTAEPVCGWNAMPEPEKTSVWETKFMGGKCINLVGTDSPNFDVAEGEPIPFPRLINRKFANRIAHDHGEGSFEYYRLVKGVMKVAFVHSRVITRQLCRDHHALDQVSWKNDQQTRIYALDPSYGGEDRCVGMPGMFGEDIDGNQILLLMPYRVFPIDLRKVGSAEDQIAEILEQELKTYEVTPENTFYDSCGKGTIGAAFARRFGHRVPVAVDAGARPSKRPVREDLFVEENDGTKRLKRCDEHYSKFVSELWFSVRYAIEADQVRGLLEDVMTEGCARIYEMAGGNKIEVEPKSDPKKKEDLKRRLGKSPDLFDTVAILMEGARQRGFKIRRLTNPEQSNSDSLDWLKKKVDAHKKLIQSKQLTYA